uniref:MmgE/PrpD family protein n=1 Tax=Lotharella oceanica TaxID=641309 RepID=A0A7S2TL65_9EUKA|mmetsp:Transcript_19248/g.36214  ORF Transcript_19248/g.36214 Transcript_19248/m.36214 type:complete len:521 (+) Transcript_19248:67-1629(+)
MSEMLDSKDFSMKWLDPSVEEKVIDWALGLKYKDIPQGVIDETKRAILDTLGTALGAQKLAITEIVNKFVKASFPGDTCQVWFTGEMTSALGAALANGLITDGLDMHDTGHYTKGHAGAALIPCAFACLPLADGPVSGEEFLVAMVAAYEIGYRAGNAMHESVTDYHSSGAWNALACAVFCARILKLSKEQFSHALGIAEYYGPRSEIMRVVNIPTMLKDGSGQGAFVGLQAVLLAKEGFTGKGCPVVTKTSISHLYADLGKVWRLVKFHVYKKYAVCYWAQPSIAGTISVMKNNQIKPEDVKSIVCHTFKEATGLQQGIPTNTEEAQYCILYPIAAAAYKGRVGPMEVDGAALKDPKLLELAKKVKIVVDENLTSEAGDPELKGKDTAAMTANIAWVEVTTKDGKTYKGHKARVPWDRLAGEPAPGNKEISEKFFWLGSEVGCAKETLEKVEKMCYGLEGIEDALSLETLLMAKPPAAKSKLPSWSAWMGVGAFVLAAAHVAYFAGYFSTSSSSAADKK